MIMSIQKFLTVEDNFSLLDVYRLKALQDGEPPKSR